MQNLQTTKTHPDTATGAARSAVLVSWQRQQVMRGGRRHLTARIFHVVKTRPLCNPKVNESTNWQYHADCTLRMDLPRLRDLLDLLWEVLGTPPEPSRINGVPLGSRGTGV